MAGREKKEPRKSVTKKQKRVNLDENSLMKKNALSFGLLIAALLILFQLSRYQLIQGNLTTEIIVAVVSILFFFLGLYFRKKWQSNSENSNLTQINYAKLKQLGISDREQEVLQHLADGFSNKEIADRLFITESTTKSHVSSLYQKLDVSRRAQAIVKAQQGRLVIIQ